MPKNFTINDDFYQHQMPKLKIQILNSKIDPNHHQKIHSKLIKNPYHKSLVKVIKKFPDLTHFHSSSSSPNYFSRSNTNTKKISSSSEEKKIINK
jgi:hypothetical protein